MPVIGEPSTSKLTLWQSLPERSSQSSHFFRHIPAVNDAATAAAMVATAADLPPELFPIIIGYVTDAAQGRHFLSLEGTKKHLAACSLTCLWWAQQCRPHMFQYLTLRSADDICVLRSLLASRTGRLPSIQGFIGTIQLEQSMVGPAWMYRAFLDPFLSTKRKYLTIIRPTPTKRTSPHASASSSHAGEPTPACNSVLFSEVPRTLPLSLRRCRGVSLKNLYFDTLQDVLNLLKETVIDTTITFEGVTWGRTAGLSHQSSMGLVIPRTPTEYFFIRALGQCTDPIRLVWYGFYTWTTMVHVFSAWKASWNRGRRRFKIYQYWLLLHSVDYEAVLNLSRTLHEVMDRWEASGGIPEVLLETAQPGWESACKLSFCFGNVERVELTPAV